MKKDEATAKEGHDQGGRKLKANGSCEDAPAKKAGRSEARVAENETPVGRKLKPQGSCEDAPSKKIAKKVARPSPMCRNAWVRRDGDSQQEGRVCVAWSGFDERR